MSHRLPRLLAICSLVLVSTTSAAAQVAMPEGDAQRSRVFATRSVEAAPKGELWRLERLFKLRFSEEFTTQNGPFTIRGELPTFQRFTRPIVSDGIIFFTIQMNDGYFYAVDATSGKQIVTLKFDKKWLSTPAAIGETAFFGTSTGNVYAYNATTKTRKWTFSQKGAFFDGAEPVIEDGLLYLCGDEAGVFALETETGALRWSFKSEKFLSGPAVQGDYVIVRSETALIALDTKTGTKRWESKIGRNFFGPQILGEQIFVRHKEGEIRSYAIADGALKWKSKKAGGTETSLALFKDMVIYGEEYGNVIALEAQTGVEKWRFKTKKTCRTPSIAGEILYARCDDHNLYALDPQTGALKWSFDSGASGGVPTIANGVMYVLTSNGTLQALR